MTIETQMDQLIDAVRGIDSESNYDYRDHFNAVEWDLGEIRKHLEDIANALKIIANK
jgi:hypothetical protein